MYKELKELLNRSISKYYKFKVSAIVLCSDGNKIGGVNVETSSPSAGICAERNALYAAFSLGYTKDDIKELHVMVDKEIPSMPCFICRQALADFLDENTTIYLYNKNGLSSSILLKELIPYKFSEEDLI